MHKMILYNPLLISLLIFPFLVACESKTYDEGNRLYFDQVKRVTKIIEAIPGKDLGKVEDILNEFIGSPNFNLRKPNYIIIHHTGEENYRDVLQKFINPRSEVSSHYLIDKNGHTVSMVNDYFRSWHAGAGKWGTISDVNSTSIGIELDNNGYEPFADVQINSLLRLLRELVDKYNIPASNILAHSDISYRKVDPNSYFPWDLLAKNGFGVWYDEDLVIPEDLDVKASLRIIGYNVDNLDSAIIAFKRHYIQENILPSLSENERAILENISVKVLGNSD